MERLLLETRFSQLESKITEYLNKLPSFISNIINNKILKLKSSNSMSNKNIDTNFAPSNYLFKQLNNTSNIDNNTKINNNIEYSTSSESNDPKTNIPINSTLNIEGNIENSNEWQFPRSKKN